MTAGAEQVAAVLSRTSADLYGTSAGRPLAAFSP